MKLRTKLKVQEKILYYISMAIVEVSIQYAEVYSLTCNDGSMFRHRW
jgi:hypothetical protein